MGSRLAVKLIDLEDKTDSGIILFRPDATDPDQAEVIGVGQGTKTKKGTWIPSSVKLGDRVIVPKGVGIPLKLDGEDLVIVTEEEILGIVEE
ncbi:co-chaperone GroES [Methylophilaceae bacterium]|nr:co-chaperone GroES [Methylophilaceae bacterium]